MTKHTIPTLDEQIAAFRARTSHAALFPHTSRGEDHRAENLDRLRRHDNGDMSERCYWCGQTYVNTGNFPYCSRTCAVAAETDR